MNSVRCVNCSLVNFTTASECKRCGAPLGSAEESESQREQFVQSETYAGPISTPSSEYSEQSASYFDDTPAAPESHRKMVGVIIGVIICLVAVVGVPWYLNHNSELANLEWKEFQPDNKAFSILMPGEPKRNSVSKFTQAGTIYTTTYTYETEGGSAFAIGYVAYPANAPTLSVDLLFDEAIDAMTGNGQQMIVLNKKTVVLDGYTVMELEVKAPAQNTIQEKGIFRLYWAPPRMYILGASSPDSKEGTAVRKKYLDSFKINQTR